MGARYKKRRRGRATRVRRDHERHLAVHGAFESGPALAHEVVTDVSRAVFSTRLALGGLSEIDRRLAPPPPHCARCRASRPRQRAGSGRG